MGWNFDNSLARELDGYFAPWQAEAPEKAKLISYNDALAERLGLPLAEESEQSRARWLGGAEVPEGAQPVALAYSGHQFGQFNPQLGDGRALLLGEIVAADGARFDMQFKGSGRTPFSRGGDGKLVLGPALREYLISEAMAALGIPTMRALSVVTTGERVYRQAFHPGAVLMRVGASHLRVGTFEFAAAHKEIEELRKLADYAIARHYPHSAKAANPYLALLDAVMNAQIALVSSWMHVGFVHGVMNTDNVTISGETIDYGPCAFLDAYAANAVFSSIDEGGRYAFANQPNICRWNMTRLGSALAPLITKLDAKGIDKANALLGEFPERYHTAWLDGMRRKLGLQSVAEGDLDLAADLFVLMEGQEADFTLFFRHLARVPAVGPSAVTHLFKQGEVIEPWLERWQERLANEGLADAERVAIMQAANPVYIPRNHKVEEALQAAEKGDMEPFERLLEAVRHPYGEREGLEEYELPAPANEGRYVTFCGT